MFVDNGMNDFSFVDEFSTMVVKSPYDADLRKSTFKELLHILFSELKPSIPSSSTEIQELAIPPDEFETGMPSRSPVGISSEITLLGIATQAPSERVDSPAPVTSPQLKPALDSSPELSLPANTRVDFTNSSAAMSWLTAHLFWVSILAHTFVQLC